jgi:hypothetical protein
MIFNETNHADNLSHKEMIIHGEFYLTYKI